MHSENQCNLPSPPCDLGKNRDTSPAPTSLPRTLGRTTVGSVSVRPDRTSPPRTVGSTTPHAPARTCTRTGSPPCTVSATETHCSDSGLDVTQDVQNIVIRQALNACFILSRLCV